MKISERGSESPRTLAIVHLCCGDAWDVMEPYLRAIERLDLRVSFCREIGGGNRDRIRAACPAADFALDSDDIEHFLESLNELDLGLYDLVCKVTDRYSDGHDNSCPSEAWLSQLDRLLRGPGVAQRMWRLFRDDPFVGLVVGDTHRYAMFWTKPIALTGLRRQRARDLVLGRREAYEDVPDGSRTAIRRAVEMAGYDVRLMELAATGARAGLTVGGRHIKTVAFYLPQFHRVTENDAWWGKGFTEWTAVSRARPLYEGHRQPRLPTDLGFYDLRVAETRREQAELARRYGIHAFCYYYYWFDGRRILERPLNEVLTSGEPDFPFCICWANENWTRRWDGLEDDILLRQSYSADSSRRFIRDVIPILQDPRYLRYDGKPVLIVYRVREIPDIEETLRIWRQECRAAQVGEIHIAGVRFWDIVNVQSLGFDAAIDFPPHHVAVRKTDRTVRGLVPNFSGLIYDYEHVVKSNLESRGHGYDEPSHRGVMLAWDNTPRRGTAAHVAHGATPALYQQWLRGVIDQEMQFNRAPESIIFINAWNEWAEGANLEPDDQFGSGFLEATQAALSESVSYWAGLMPDRIHR